MYHTQTAHVCGRFGQKNHHSGSNALPDSYFFIQIWISQDALSNKNYNNSSSWWRTHKATEWLHIPLQNAFLVHCYFFLTATACSASLASGSWSHVYTIQTQAWALHLTHWLCITFFEKFWITSHAWKRKSSSLSTVCLYPDLWMGDGWLKKIFHSFHLTSTSYFHNISHSIDHKIAAWSRSYTAKKSTTYNEFSTALCLHEKSFSDPCITGCLCCIFQQLMVTTVCWI